MTRLLILFFSTLFSIAAFAASEPAAIARANGQILYQNCKGQSFNYGNLQSSLLPSGNVWVVFNERWGSNPNCKEVTGQSCPAARAEIYMNGNNIACRAPTNSCQSKNGNIFGSQWVSGSFSTPVGGLYCSEGCQVNMDAAIRGKDDSDNWQTRFEGSYTGQECTGSEGLPVPAEPPDEGGGEDPEPEAPNGGCPSYATPRKEGETTYCDPKPANCQAGFKEQLYNGRNICVPNNSGEGDTGGGDDNGGGENGGGGQSGNGDDPGALCGTAPYADCKVRENSGRLDTLVQGQAAGNAIAESIESQLERAVWIDTEQLEAIKKQFEEQKKTTQATEKNLEAAEQIKQGIEAQTKTIEDESKETKDAIDKVTEATDKTTQAIKDKTESDKTGVNDIVKAVNEVRDAVKEQGPNTPGVGGGGGSGECNPLLKKCDEDGDDVEDSGLDMDLPGGCQAGTGCLYESKYPDGLKGVFDGFMGDVKESQIFQLPRMLLPDFDGGTCPSWTINFNFGRYMNLGSHTVEPPCWIWDAGRAIVFVLSLILARRLVFGG